MKRKISASLCILTLLPAALCADYTRGLYGKIEYVLMHDNVSDKYNDTDRKSFVQNYQLGYESFIYSPRLLTYDLGFSLYIDNSNTDVNNNGTEIKSKNETKHTNYKAYLNFIKKTRYPFTIFYEKIDSPLWSTAPNGTTLVTYKTDKSGIYGRAKLETFNLNYEYKQTKTEKTESFAFENGDNRRFAIGLSKQFDENKTASINYSHETRDYYRTDRGLNYQDSWHDVVDNAIATYSWIISKTVQFTGAVNYLKNEYLEYENLSGTASLNWAPNEKHNENFSITVDNSKTREGSNTFISANEAGSYIHTENLTTSHSFQVYNARGDLYNLTLASVTGGVNYLKSFSDTFNTSVGATVTGDRQNRNIRLQ